VAAALGTAAMAASVGGAKVSADALMRIAERLAQSGDRAGGMAVYRCAFSNGTTTITDCNPMYGCVSYFPADEVVKAFPPDQALQLAADLSEPGDRAHMLGLIWRVQTEAGDPASADETYRMDRTAAGSGAVARGRFDGSGSDSGEHAG